MTHPQTAISSPHQVAIYTGPFSDRHSSLPTNTSKQFHFDQKSRATTEHSRAAVTAQPLLNQAFYASVSHVQVGMGLPGLVDKLLRQPLWDTVSANSALLLPRHNLLSIYLSLSIHQASSIHLSIYDLWIYQSILYYLAAQPSRNNVRCTWTPREASARPRKRYKYSRDQDDGCLSPLQCSMPIVQIDFTALHDANDALLGVQCITRITRPHVHCFSDPRFGALSPGKLRVHPLKWCLFASYPTPPMLRCSMLTAL